MREELEVTLYGYPVGTLLRVGVEDYEFVYDAAWASSAAAVPLSLSLPLRTRRHRGRVVANFVDNLLPDNPDVRERWAIDAGLDTTEPFYLLAEYGHDVAGAASFQKPGASSQARRTPVHDDDVAERVRRLRADGTAWHDDDREASGQFSLGGAQRKFSLARRGDSWFETSGAEPSTHIFKPQVDGLVDGELVEYLVMRTARTLGIPVAAVELFEHGGEHALVVERFDRRWEDGEVVRLHQEDLLQSLGLPRLRKYEVHGGPGIDEIAAVLRREGDPHSLERYAIVLAFSWIMLSTDAHAKNSSVFLGPDGAILTPLYDASSLLPYLADDPAIDAPSLRDRAADIRLSVRYGASDRAGDVGAFEIGAIARRCGMSADHLLAVTATHVLEVADVVADVAEQMPATLQTDTIARMVEWMPLRARQAADALGLAGLVGE